MNRNVNMTGNFSNAKSLKPGDTAFNSRKRKKKRIYLNIPSIS